MVELFMVNIYVIIPNRTFMVRVSGISVKFGRAMVLILAPETQSSQNTHGETR